MADSKGPHWYYAAAIMWIRDNREWESASVTQLDDWQTEPVSDGWGNDSSEKLLVDVELLEKALNLLAELGMIERVFDQFGPEILVFNPNWQEQNSMEVNASTPFYRTSKYGEKWIREAIIKINSLSEEDENEEVSHDPEEVQSSLQDDSIWKPLPIDREATEYEETIAGIEEAIREIGADNGFSATFPDERNNLIDHANATLKSAKDGKVTRKQIKEHLIGAGRWVASKFAGSAIGAVGKNLMEWGLKLLGFLG